MKIEYEATFTDIDKYNIRKKLKKTGAVLKKKEFTQTRKTFNFPKRNKNGYIRVRDEDGKITMTLKICDGIKICNQKEAEIIVDDFDTAVIILKKLGATEKAFQETKREIWELDGVEIMIDEWPFLEPFVEIEGKNEEEVKKVTKKLDFDWQDAYFGLVTGLYVKKYGIPAEQINDKTPKIIFNMKNPFI